MDKIEPIHLKIPMEHSKYHDHGRETRYEAFGYQGKRPVFNSNIMAIWNTFKISSLVVKLLKPLINQIVFLFSVKVLEIEVNYSDGIKLWLLGETTILRVLSPKSIADDIRDTLREGYERYLELKKQPKLAVFS
jgi:hypothetical protein